MENDIRKWQMLELDILTKTVDICEQNNIKYFLAYGTLLGAVRHKGFIPWDDDVDIIMPIKDYNKFCKIAPEYLKEVDLFLQTHKTDPEYNSMWAKVRADGTTSMPINEMNYNIHWGACIDIFPLFGLYNSKLFEKMQYKLFAINTLLLNVDRNRALNKKIGKREKLISYIPRKVRHFIVNLNNLFIDADNNKTNYSAVKFWEIIEKCQSSLYQNITELCFEGKEFRVPEEYDKLLRSIYGDYMILPPESERQGHELLQGETIFDTDKDYKEYKNNMLV